MIAGIPVGVLSCVYDVFMRGGMNMGQKDLSEKLLADYNDVFADIINVLILGGQHKIDAKDLITETVHSQYKADDLDEYVNDYRIHVFDIAWLTDEQLSQFESDFGIVANFFVQKRKNKGYVPADNRIIEHVDAVLKLLSVMTGDNRYESILSSGKKEGISMCDVAERLEQRGIQRGIEQGIEQGLRMIYHLISERKLSAFDAAQELQQTKEELLSNMREAGYETQNIL